MLAVRGRSSRSDITLGNLWAEASEEILPCSEGRCIFAPTCTIVPLDAHYPHPYTATSRSVAQIFTKAALATLSPGVKIFLVHRNFGRRLSLHGFSSTTAVYPVTKRRPYFSRRRNPLRHNALTGLRGLVRTLRLVLCDHLRSLSVPPHVLGNRRLPPLFLPPFLQD